MRKRFIENIDLFDWSPPVERAKNGKLFDKRQIQGIDPLVRYTAQETARFLGCSDSLIYELTNRSRRNGRYKKIDSRHWQDFAPEKKYLKREVARKFGCSEVMIYRLGMNGALQKTRLRHSYRFNGFSIIDFIKENASPLAAQNEIEFLAINSLIRIPGWSLIDYIQRHCTEI